LNVIIASLFSSSVRGILAVSATLIAPVGLFKKLFERLAEATLDIDRRVRKIGTDLRGLDAQRADRMAAIFSGFKPNIPIYLFG
jgi:hypothetical protein